ncbi:hypothetical protein [Mycolicibacter arupensis]|jgi:hypothetical protein|uniref:hypothetical protein n=1 Tax=Mycolicibacter arupensis TaxID=342002 RepID=UPI00122C3B83|nr:hypothetical protein [Mycolicibacter arupensis]KAA1432696.1 hypothetical protein F0402_01565 [Mycolicibacter arupensis]
MSDELLPIRARCADNCIGMDVPTGWMPLMLELDAALAEVAPALRYIQIKQKFAELRVYVTATTDDRVHDLIHDAERRSRTICEECGSVGKSRRRAQSGWYRALCDDHSEGYVDA